MASTATARDTDGVPVPSDLPASAPVLNDLESGAATPTGQSLSGPNEADDGKTKKKGGGRTAGDEDEPDLPHNNMWLVLPSIGLVLFLAALDQTIVATALPTIAEKFNATPSEYSWVVTSYQLAMTLMTPINGRLSDITGRKPLLYAAIIVFFIFSAVSGAAKNMTWLIVARAFQGLGGGTIIGMSNIVVSDITPMAKRGAYAGILGATWGVAAVVGPIVGGALTQKVSWRWCFYINLPTCGVAFIALAMSLKLNPPKGHTFRQFLSTFDFIGLLLVMVSGSLLIVGFSFAADHSFGDHSAIACIVVGGVCFILVVINCLVTKRIAVIPARTFKVRTTLFYLIASTLHATAFIPSNVLLPEFFQGVRGADALESGIQLLPYAILVSWGTVLAGQVQARLRIVRPVTWVGYALAALGFGTMYGFYNGDQSLSQQYGLTIIPAIGVGLSLASPLLVMQAAMPIRDMAAVTSAWTLTRSLGGSVGISIFTAVLNTNLRSKFSKIPGYGTEFEVPTSAAGYRALHALPEGPLKDQIMDAFADSFKPVWLISMILMLLCLALAIPTRSYSLNRGPGRAAKPQAETDEANKETKETKSGSDTPALPVAEEKDLDAAGETASRRSGSDSATTANATAVDNKEQGLA